MENGMKDHEKRELVNQITQIARDFGCTQQLRGRVAEAVLSALDSVINRERESHAKTCDEWARICDSGKRHGAKVGAQECAKLIRASMPNVELTGGALAPSSDRRERG